MDPDKGTYATRLTLLAKVQNRYDEASWSEFIENYRKYIEAVVSRMGIGPSDVADVTQEVLLKLWKAIPELDLQKLVRFRSYLVSVTRNCVYDYVRKVTGRRGNRQERFQQYLEGLDRMKAPEVDALAEQEWRKYVYETAMERVGRKLSPKAMAVFKASLLGRSIREIASEMNMGESTAFALKARVKESLLKEVRAINDYLE